MMQEERVIYHIDCNGFYASVEEVAHPELKRVAMAVCGDPQNRRGVILAKNELAKQHGVKTGESIWQARQKCPQLFLMPARHHEYQKYCEKANSIYETYTDQVERFGIDESYLDVTGSLHLFGNDAIALAHRIKDHVHEALGITVSVGVSFNKAFAKVASDLKKPNAVSVIGRDDFKEVLWPMPVSVLMMVGKGTREKLAALNINTIGELAMADMDLLHSVLGKVGRSLHDCANGRGDSQVLSIAQEDHALSIGNGMTFKRSLVTEKDIRIAVNNLADVVAARMRRYGQKCKTVHVAMKDEAFATITRQTSVGPTFLARDIARVARQLIAANWRAGTPMRTLTITASNLIFADQAKEQLSWFDEAPKDALSQEKLEKTIDGIREKYGRSSISFGSALNNDLGIDIRDKREREQRD